MSNAQPEPTPPPKEEDVITITHSPDGDSAVITVTHPDDTQTVVVISPKP